MRVTQIYQRIPLRQGAFFTTVREEKFKFSHLSCHVVLPLAEQTASLYALVPMVLRRGSRAYADMTALGERLSELYGAQLDWDVSKRGEEQVLSLTLEILNDRFALEGEHLLAEGAALLAGVIFDPALENGLLRAADVEIEKRNLCDLIRSQLNDKRVYASHRLKEEMCRGEAYGVSEYGTVEAAEAVTPQALTEAWRTALTRARMEILYVGPGNGADVRAIFARPLAALLRGEVLQGGTQVLRAPAGAVRESTERLPVTQAKLGLGFRAGVAAPDADADAMQMACTVLGGSPHALLFQNVREKLSLCYYCYARFERSKGLVLIESGIEEANAERARAEILKQLETLKAGGFSQDDLRFARLSLQNSYEEINDAPGGIASWYLAQSFYERVRTPQETAAAMAAITKEDVVRVAQHIALDTIYLLAGEAAEKEGA